MTASILIVIHTSLSNLDYFKQAGAVERVSGPQQSFAASFGGFRLGGAHSKGFL